MGRACYFTDESRYAVDESPVNWSGTSGPGQSFKNSFNDKPPQNNFLTVKVLQIVRYYRQIQYTSTYINNEVTVLLR